MSDSFSDIDICFSTLKCLYDFQTLIAGVLGVIFISWQIRQTGTHERHRLRVKEKAGRAVLPLTLDSIAEYAKRSTKILIEIYNTKDGDVIPRNNAISATPIIPEAAITSLQSFIESTPDDDIAALAAKIIQNIQIQKARIFSSIESISTTDNNRIFRASAYNFEQHIIDTAIIYEMTTSLFCYAREENNKIPELITWKDVIRALHILDIREDNYPRIFEMINERASNNRQIL